MNRMVSIMIACLFMAVIGCASPTVNLARINSPNDMDDDVIDTFHLQKSLIIVDSATKNEQLNFTIVSEPQEATDFKIGVRKAGWFWAKTSLNISKRENMDLVKDAGVEVIDYRIDTIKSLASIAMKTASMVGFAGKSMTLPKRIYPLVILEQNNILKQKSDSLDTADGVTVEFGPIPPDGKPIAEFNRGNYRGLIYSACRTATIRFKHETSNFERQVKISDPRFFQFIAFPDKGSISFHSECGVSVKSDKESGIASTVAILEALADQAKAVKEALDKGKAK